MIRPLRQIHRRLITGLALVVPTLALAGLLLRPELRTTGDLPLATSCAQGAAVGQTPLDGLAGRVSRIGHVIRFEGLRQGGALPAGILVYLVSEKSDVLALDARLLPSRWGACDEATLPPDATGAILLYSAVEGRVLGGANLPSGEP